MVQIIIAITGVIAIWLANDQRDSHRRYACLFGLGGQPFWLYATYTSGQWGIFILALFYTAAWGKGLWVYWLSRCDAKGIPQVNNKCHRAAAELRAVANELKLCSTVNGEWDGTEEDAHEEYDRLMALADDLETAWHTQKKPQ